eukprot:jgi/Orpsp1_1/1180966/evm.model.c7180000075273.1
MNFSIISFYLIVLSYIIGNSNTLELNALAFAPDDKGDAFKSYVNEFNKFAKENNRDIKIKLNLMMRRNYTFSIENYSAMVESLLKKKNNKYDIYFYNNSATKKYYQYLLDLGTRLPKDHINMYDKNIISQILPKTWDQLISTGKEILEKEKLLNNTKLVGYNGLFSNPEQTIGSAYEFIHSCRESYESSFPEIKSQTTVEAIKLLKRIKEEISSDEIFRSDPQYSEQLIFSGNIIFAKFFVFDSAFQNENFPYKISKLPGIKEGISSSIIGGYNIGIDGNINKNKEESAIEVLKFITSKEFQKKLALKKVISSGILSLYDDEELCSSTKNCEYYKNLQ